MAESTRRILPPEWRAFLEETLTHRVNIVRAGPPTLEGNPTDLSVAEQIPCFIVPSRTRIITGVSREQQASFSVNFPPDCGIKTDDRLEHGVTLQGDEILEVGRVIRLDPETDPSAGLILWTAYVANGSG